MAENKKTPETNSLENEVIFEEVAQYYKGMEHEESDVSNKKATTEFSFGFNIDDKLSEEIFEFKNAGAFSDLLFFLCSIFLALAAIATAYNISMMNVDENEVSQATALLRETDEDYINASDEQERLNTVVSALTAEDLDLKEREGTIKDFSDTKTALEEKANELKAEEKAINDKVYDKRTEVEALRESSDSGSYSLTLTPGVYTVGKNIPKGTFSVTSAGSIIVSTTAKEVKTNEQLNEKTPSSIKLEDGWTVKINKKTTFSLGDGQADEN